ncbi:MAG: diguanylate cyclase [Lachnospiraceae bacterium]|nr:diguanylate cyclase [Lachnospiraceae bacterium]
MENKRSIEEYNSIILSAYRALIRGTKDMVFIKDVNQKYVGASDAFIKMMGVEEEAQLLGRTDMEILDDKNLAKRYMDDDKKILASGADLVDYVEPITDEDGHARYGSTCKYVLKDEDGKLLGILGLTKDITREYMARQHYQQELKLLFELPKEAYAVSYIDIDDWRIISQRRKEISKGTLEPCNTVEELAFAAADAILDKESKAYLFYKDFTQDMLRELYDSGKTEVSFKYERRLTNGLVRWVHNRVRFLTDVDSGHLCALLTAKDIDAEKKAEQDLIVSAKMDKMTMVLNRETTMNYIREILIKQPDTNHVLLMLDVDNFKLINDTYGHQTGDQFLIKLADELKHHFRETDVVGRIGGDEFFALMKNVPDLSIVPRKADQILDTIIAICDNYEGINLSGSIGISTYPEDGDTVEKLYAKADDALYQAKRKGKNQFIFANS